MIGVNHPCENAVVYTASPSSLHTTSTVCAARIQPRLAVPGDATWFGDGNIWDLPGLAVKRGIARSGSKGASMPTDTAAVIKRFNNAFLQHDPDKLVDLIGDDCVMESAQPAPNGTRYEGYDACLGFWREQIADPNGSFGPEEVVVSGDRATIRWRYRFGVGDENSVRGVNLMHVRNGKIVEALGYVKAGLKA
jgi:ketosteroid isomerase-like protein